MKLELIYSKFENSASKYDISLKKKQQNKTKPNHSSIPIVRSIIKYFANLLLTKISLRNNHLIFLLNKINKLISLELMNFYTFNKNMGSNRKFRASHFFVVVVVDELIMMDYQSIDYQFLTIIN